MERTNIKIYEKEETSAVFGDWKLNFTIERLQGVPDKVNVTGTKTGGYFNASWSLGSTHQTSFSGSAGYDKDLANAVIDEMNAIITPIEEEVTE